MALSAPQLNPRSSHGRRIARHRHPPLLVLVAARLARGAAGRAGRGGAGDPPGRRPAAARGDQRRHARRAGALPGAPRRAGVGEPGDLRVLRRDRARAVAGRPGRPRRRPVDRGGDACRVPGAAPGHADEPGPANAGSVPDADAADIARIEAIWRAARTAPASCTATRSARRTRCSPPSSPASCPTCPSCRRTPAPTARPCGPIRWWPVVRGRRAGAGGVAAGALRGCRHERRVRAGPCRRRRPRPGAARRHLRAAGLHAHPGGAAPRQGDRQSLHHAAARLPRADRAARPRRPRPAARAAGALRRAAHHRARHHDSEATLARLRRAGLAIAGDRAAGTPGGRRRPGRPAGPVRAHPAAGRAGRHDPAHQAPDAGRHLAAPLHRPRQRGRVAGGGRAGRGRSGRDGGAVLPPGRAAGGARPGGRLRHAAGARPGADAAARGPGRHLPGRDRAGGAVHRGHDGGHGRPLRRLAHAAGRGGASARGGAACWCCPRPPAARRCCSPEPHRDGAAAAGRLLPRLRSARSACWCTAWPVPRAARWSAVPCRPVRRRAVPPRDARLGAERDRPLRARRRPRPAPAAPDLVEVHNRPEIALLLARRFRRVLLFLHNDPQGMRGAATAAERRTLLRRLAGVAVVSDHLRERFAAGPRRRAAELGRRAGAAAPGAGPADPVRRPRGGGQGGGRLRGRLCRRPAAPARLAGGDDRRRPLHARQPADRGSPRGWRPGGARRASRCRATCRTTPCWRAWAGPPSPWCPAAGRSRSA